MAKMIGVCGNLVRLLKCRSRGWGALEGLRIVEDALHAITRDNNIVIHFDWNHFPSAKLSSITL